METQISEDDRDGFCRNIDFYGDSLTRTPPFDSVSYSYILYCSTPNAPYAFAPAKRVKNRTVHEAETRSTTSDSTQLNNVHVIRNHKEQLEAMGNEQVAKA